MTPWWASTSSTSLNSSNSWYHTFIKHNSVVLPTQPQVRLNDIQRLEAVVPALQQGSIDAEGASLSSHNYVQLFRLVQLAVEHLWQMRESHAKLYPAYAAAVAAAER